MSGTTAVVAVAAVLALIAIVAMRSIDIDAREHLAPFLVHSARDGGA